MHKREAELFSGELPTSHASEINLQLPKGTNHYWVVKALLTRDKNNTSPRSKRFVIESKGKNPGREHTPPQYLTNENLEKLAIVLAFRALQVHPK